MSLIRAATTVGGLTAVSRVAGFARDVLMARYLGAGLAADAFLVAFRLPNLFRSLFAEGAFSAGFVPMVAARMRSGKDGSTDASQARGFTEDALAILLPALLLFTAVVMVATGPVVFLMTGGFGGDAPEKFALTVELTRLTFPYLLLISLVALLGGVLNALGRFAIPAMAPIFLNAVLIAAILFARGDGTEATARALAAGVSIAGVVQFIAVSVAVARAGAAPWLRLPRWTAEMAEMFRRIGPAAIGAGATQINLFVSTLIAASLLPEGSVSYLYYADRLNQLPLGIIGIGMGIALLPTMSRLISSGSDSAAVHQQNRAIEFALLLTIPAATALVVAALPIVTGLFRQGAFTSADAQGAAAALAAFSLGLPAYVLIKVLTPGFHARGDTRTPMRVAIGAILINLVGNLSLIWVLGHVGIALATAIAAWVNAAVLWFLLDRRSLFAVDAQLRRVVPRMLGAALAMAAVLWALSGPLMPWLEGGATTRVAGLAILIGAGGLTYLAAGRLTGAYDLAYLRDAFRRSSAT
ncbi:MAG: murein biosynthesis integral membrane protein MurJ [Thermaurantiacus sp.]